VSNNRKRPLTAVNGEPKIGYKEMKKWLFTGIGIILSIAIVFVGISAYLGYSMTRTPRVPVEGNPGLKGLEYEGVTFPSSTDNLTLQGWFLSNKNSDRVIIMVHGADSNRADTSNGMLDIAAGLVTNDYNVLMFDLRGCGESDGSMVSGGYFEKRDLEGAVEYIKARGFSRIGVLGFSLGAVTAILQAADDNDIQAVVSDSSFADLNDIMRPEFSARTRAPEIFLYPILFMIKVMYGVDFPAIRPIASVDDIAPRPIFFIQGDADETIPVEHARRLFQAADNPQDQLWIVPGAGHTQSYNTYPEEYLKRITAFFDDSL
jgi:dipeptidyl aminopeptidase/acylaminoacyl peptidase